MMSHDSAVTSHEAFQKFLCMFNLWQYHVSNIWQNQLIIKTICLDQHRLIHCRLTYRGQKGSISNDVDLLQVVRRLLQQRCTIPAHYSIHMRTTWIHKELWNFKIPEIIFWAWSKNINFMSIFLNVDVCIKSSKKISYFITTNKALSILV